MNYKKFEELTLRDDFIFGKVMMNKTICKRMLEILLSEQIESIEYPETQKAINISYQGKSVRLDVYVEDNKHTVYNTEMQQKKDKTSVNQLSKRSRYYQGMIDLNLIDKGLPYTTLHKSYIIFICTFDPFGKGKYQYTFRPLCQEDNSLTLADETTRIFFNTKGNLKGAPKGLRKFFEYIETNLPADAFTKSLDDEVKRTKQNKKWRREYMKELLHDYDIKEEGRQEGRQEGEQKINRLIQILAQQNRTDDIIKSAHDESYQKQLLKELQI